MDSYRPARTRTRTWYTHAHERGAQRALAHTHTHRWPQLRRRPSIIIICWELFFVSFIVWFIHSSVVAALLLVVIHSFIHRLRTTTLRFTFLRPYPHHPPTQPLMCIRSWSVQTHTADTRTLGQWYPKYFHSTVTLSKVHLCTSTKILLLMCRYRFGRVTM